MDDEALRQHRAEWLNATNVQLALVDYDREIDRRIAERRSVEMLDHSRKMVRMTQWVAGCTLVVTLATIVNVILAA